MLFRDGGNFRDVFWNTTGIWEVSEHMGLSENRVNLPNEIAIFHRDNDQQNHWVFRGVPYFQTNPFIAHLSTIYPPFNHHL